ncbi:MAG: hypothetical protein MZU91_04805 [Desulfosudis oleivorans]|nr:hypothetical protein [Desulfosudis oleivorans]
MEDCEAAGVLEGKAHPSTTASLRSSGDGSWIELRAMGVQDRLPAPRGVAGGPRAP